MKRRQKKDGPQEPGVEKFLTFVANIKTMGDAEVVLRKYVEFLPPRLLSVTPQDVRAREAAEAQWEREFGGEGPPLTQSDLRQERVVYFVGGIGSKLRKIWDEQDARRREWLIFRVREFYHQLADPVHRYDPPPLTRFEEAMLYLGRNAERARRCINPKCPAPYFLSKDSRPRTFCSPDCAGPAKRQAKLKWWRKKPRRGTRQP